MHPIDAYIYNKNDNPELIAVMEFLHELMSSFPEITYKIHYTVPFYKRKKWVCYMSYTLKKDAVQFSFIKGHLLSNAQGLLEAKGRKQVTSVDFRKVEDIPVEALIEILHEAFLLDD